MSDERLKPKGTIEVIDKVHWLYFVTIPLPHKRGLKSDTAIRIWNGFRGRFCKLINHSPKELLWVVCLETGPSGGNPHLHALIGGRPAIFNGADILQTIKEIESEMELPSINVLVYEGRRNAASYICKELSRSEKDAAALDGYWPIISDSVWRTLARRPNLR
ncbi:MAG: hypothetical protein EOP84_03650 [Verrucomicrobiaceae bacterium]|nr:MAG: hypothetical protein EOP84_03650 [Verrucomicrobiaceae bacterium]